MNTLFERSVRCLSRLERPTFTPRESDVLELLAQGRLYKEIADELRLSISAVHKHQHRLFLKLHVENRTEAAIKWIETKSHWQQRVDL